MSTTSPRTITVAVPAETYESFRLQAERARQSVEQAVVQAMQATLTDEPASDDQRHAMLVALERIDTAVLRQLLQRGAETEEVLVLAALNEKRQQATLSPAEEGAARMLIQHHDRAVLIRAKALAVLSERGEDVSGVVSET